MGMWLYQLSAEKELDEHGTKYTPEEYRQEVREGKYYVWSTRQIRSRSKKRPATGDTIFYWYTKSSTSTPGLYGWGIVSNFNEADGKISHVPIFPSDYLKKKPICCQSMEEIIKLVQDRMPQATLLEIESREGKKLLKKISKLIRSYC